MTSISLSLDGSNKASFELDKTTEEFEIIYTLPIDTSIASITMTETTKVGTTAVIITNAPLTIYWAL